MPTDRSRRLPRDPDQPMRFLRVDSSWYENYWFGETVPRPAGRSAANLATIAAWLRLAFDRMARRYLISGRTGIERVENALRRHAMTAAADGRGSGLPATPGRAHRSFLNR
jgi:hypothetical protein